MPSLRITHLSELTPQDLQILFERRGPLEELIPTVQSIMQAVRLRGDDALRDFTTRFDGVSLDELEVSRAEFTAARSLTSSTTQAALEAQIAAVQSFHQPQVPHEAPIQTAPGVLAWREWRPIERVGCYVPGGRGPYPSSVVMLGVPAVLAGCTEIVICTPPHTDGSVPPATLVAAEMVGVHRVFKLGGAQAIAAMAYGTASVPQVDKLFGAGNSFVTVAKLLAFPGCALDSPAGPSELLIIADQSANPAWVAADLLSDAEHGPDSAAVLVTTSRSLAEAVASAIEGQIDDLPRHDVARRALSACGLAVVVDSMEEAIALANRYAAEHLEIMVEDASALVAQIQHAGSVFVGPYAPNAAGDYATGTNHVLPTARYARTFAPVSVESFGRLIQFQQLTAEGLRTLLPTVQHLAREEGLEGHARAIEIRFGRQS